MNLSECEKFVMKGFSEGLTALEIAARQGWYSNLPHIFSARVKKKLNARTRIQAVSICIRKGLI